MNNKNIYYIGTYNDYIIIESLLPQSLQKLYCVYNFLTSLPDNLPQIAGKASNFGLPQSLQILDYQQEQSQQNLRLFLLDFLESTAPPSFSDARSMSSVNSIGS